MEIDLKTSKDKLNKSKLILFEPPSTFSLLLNELQKDRKTIHKLKEELEKISRENNIEYS